MYKSLVFIPFDYQLIQKVPEQIFLSVVICISHLGGSPRCWH
jgi:hypothetical protein